MARLSRRTIPSCVVLSGLLATGCAGGSVTAAGPAMTHRSGAAVARPLVARARWLTTADGRRLRVRPTRYGRNHAALDAPAALRQALATAGSPQPLAASVRATLTDQLRCHAVFAPRKPVWDLESWRPDVGYVATVAHGCNP